jgi:hypothetical protein
MENPFSYSGIVTGDSFCNRENELTEFRQLTKAGIRLKKIAEKAKVSVDRTLNFKHWQQGLSPGSVRKGQSEAFWMPCHPAPHGIHPGSEQCVQKSDPGNSAA